MSSSIELGVVLKLKIFTPVLRSNHPLDRTLSSDSLFLLRGTLHRSARAINTMGGKLFSDCLATVQASNDSNTPIGWHHSAIDISALRAANVTYEIHQNYLPCFFNCKNLLKISFAIQHSLAAICPNSNSGCCFWYSRILSSWSCVSAPMRTTRNSPKRSVESDTVIFPQIYPDSFAVFQLSTVSTQK